tara:strand:- start:42 stop:569 length:528 start_codon:yes stop_codon:yes gene_type:complete
MCEIESSNKFSLLRDEFELIQKKLMSLSMRYQKSYWEAEEVVSDTYLQAMEKWSQFEGRSKLSTWLYKICVNKNLERLRRSRSTTENLKIFAYNCLINLRYKEAEFVSLREDFRQALEKLDEREKSVFLLVVFEEFAHKEIADILDISVSNVKVILHRGRKKLMNFLSNYLESRE